MMCNAQTLLMNGIIQMSQKEDAVDESLTPEYISCHTSPGVILTFIIVLQSQEGVQNI